MIISFRSRKNIYSAKQLVNYILTDKGHIKEPFGPPLLLHNIHRLDPETVHLDFLDNHKYAKERQGSVAIYHEMVSISKLDSEHVTKSMLQDLMRAYIRLRGAENAICIAKAHIHTEHKHIHFIISGNEYKSQKRLRMSHKEMKTLLREFEAYHLKKHPELKHSIVHLNKEKDKKRDIPQEQRNKRADKEKFMLKRLNGSKQTRKEYIKEKVEKLMANTHSFQKLVEAINLENDLTIYTYRNIIKGVIDNSGRPYTFKRLGISLERQKALSQYQKRLQELELIRERQRKRLGRDRGLGRG